MRVLVVGGGGREHAIAWKISQSSLLKQLYCAPGNAGTKDFAINVELPQNNVGALALWAVENEIDLTVVGPEAPLADGIVDVFGEHGLKVFGPTKAAAQLESSKSFAKKIMLKAGVNTPKAKAFDDYEKAKEYVLQEGAPIVIKADGLASGKGVVVAPDIDVALQALEYCLKGGGFGNSGAKVLVEEFIDGKEASVIAMVDGSNVVPFVVSQDYKRIYDGDKGPNTGGMGAISPTAVLEDRRVENLVGEIFMPVLHELWNQGIKYVGFLYAGIIVDSKTGEAKVLEFNCRLGDPETQVLLTRMESDFLYALDAAVLGKLSSVELKWTKQAACCVVASSAGYPGEVDDGKELKGLFKEDGVEVFHAGTVTSPDDSDKVLTKGGRILAVSALGDTIGDAVSKAYQGIEKIEFDGMYYRKDIGANA